MELDPISIKLGEDNLATWKAEVFEKIKGSEKFITMPGYGGMPLACTEEYKIWKEEDHVVYIWLLDSISLEILELMDLEGCQHSLELWLAVEKHFLQKLLVELRSKHLLLLEQNVALQKAIISIGEEFPAITSNGKKTIEDDECKKSDSSPSP